MPISMFLPKKRVNLLFCIHMAFGSLGCPMLETDTLELTSRVAHGAQYMLTSRKIRQGVIYITL
jgi:hypothetical protein